MCTFKGLGKHSTCFPPNLVWKLTYHLHAFEKFNTCLSLQPYKHMRLQGERVKLGNEAWQGQGRRTRASRERLMKSQEGMLAPKKISSMSSKDGQWKENQGVGAWSRLLPHESEASRIFDMKDHVWMLWSKEESSKRCVLPTAFVPRFTALVPLC